MQGGSAANVVSWLVDMGYVVKASAGKFKLDYIEAERLLADRFGPVRTFLFNGFDPAYGIPEGLQAFYETMERHHIKVRLHPMQSGPPGTNRQRRVDVDFSAHMIWQAGRPEVNGLIITTGDQDFVPAVELARQRFQKPVTLFTYETMVHHDLIAGVDSWMKFEEQEQRVARY